jgi:hypothetical protein
LKCWITGIEVLPSESFGLDRYSATALRRELAQRLALLDQVLENLGTRAGSTPRAQELGARPSDRRLVCRAVAEGYGLGIGHPEVFQTWSTLQQAQLDRWLEGLLADPALAARIPESDPAACTRLYRIAARVVAGLTTDKVKAIRRARYDGLVALAYPGEKPEETDAWLATHDVFSLCGAAGIPTTGQVVALEGLESRCQIARARIVGELEPGEIEPAVELDDPFTAGAAVVQPETPKTEPAVDWSPNALYFSFLSGLGNEEES